MKLSTFGMGLLVGLSLGGCADDPVNPDAPNDAPPAPVFEGEHDPGSGVVRRLTASQYRNAMADLIGVAPFGNVEPDAQIDGLRAVGSSITSISARGVEQYEAAAGRAIEELLEDEDLRARHLPCVPVSAADVACLDEVLEVVGRRAWRRPLTSTEHNRLRQLGLQAAESLESADALLSYPLLALLTSPHFLFRAEVGDGGAADGKDALSAWSWASRVSFLLWNTTPDDTLLDAAANGDLDTPEGREEQIDRLLADGRAEDGIRALYDDLYMLHEVPNITKDPSLFPNMSATIAEAAREETLLNAVDIALHTDEDFRSFFTRRTTFLNRELAALYEVRAPDREGFGRTDLPADGTRLGFFGHASFLALKAHPVSTSPTLRGMYVRERVLCQSIPLPPADLDTSIPEPSPDAPTLRERIQRHLEEPSCAVCHRMTDMIGLGFENFDGLGRHRTLENGAQIDPSGELDGVPFEDLPGLATAITEHQDVIPCFLDQVSAYALGRRTARSERPTLAWHEEHFAWSGLRVRALLRELALSPLMREVAPPSTDSGEAM